MGGAVLCLRLQMNNTELLNQTNTRPRIKPGPQEKEGNTLEKIENTTRIGFYILPILSSEPNWFNHNTFFSFLFI